MTYIDDYQENKIKVKHLIWIFIVIFVFALGLSIAINFRPGIEVGDVFLYRKNVEWYQNNGNEIKQEKADGVTTFSIIMEEEQRTAELIWNDKMATITFDNGNVVEGTWGIWNEEERLLQEDGFPVSFEENSNVVVGDESTTQQLGDVTLSEALCKVDLEKNKTKGHWAFVLIGTVVYLLGMLCFYYPEVGLWFTRWRFVNAELSDMGKLAERIGGVFLMILGLLLILHLLPI